MAEEDEIIIETREDLVDYLNSTNYENVIIKFYASWCKPCEKVAPFVENCVEELTQKFQGNHNKFVFLELDVDESFDLYAFLKQKRVRVFQLFFFILKMFIKVTTKIKNIFQRHVSEQMKKKLKKCLILFHKKIKLKNNTNI